MPRPTARSTSTLDPAAVQKTRDRVVGIVEGLPGAHAVSHGEHVSFEARGKRFGWFLADHHGDGRIAINFKAGYAVRADLEMAMPRHAHVPKYVGSRGWMGLWLDLPKVRWAVVRSALSEACRMVAR